MIAGNCFTNIDNYSKLSWPTIFAALPREGDFVESMGTDKIRLKVVAITHYAKNNLEPRISVELNK